MTFSPNAATVYADGPASNPYQPDKSQIRALLTSYEDVMSAFTTAGGLIYSTRAEMNFDLAHSSYAMAWVIADPATGNNGIYKKIGDSGSGAWVRVGELPYSFLKADIVGGTANNIAVTTLIPISDLILAVFTLNLTTTATPIYVSFNGGASLRIRTNTGFDPDVGALRADMTLAGFKSGGDFRLLTDNMASALLSALEAIRDDAETEADRATTQANAAQASATEAAMYADMLNSAVYDFNFDSDPSDPGYDWNS
jgi:hypothetical protein